MKPLSLAAISLLTLPLLSLGCSISSPPRMDMSSLPARASLKTVGGYRLTLDPDGALVATPDGADIEAALGVSLAELDSGVVVQGRLDASSPFRRGDRLVSVMPFEAAPFEEHRERMEGLAKGKIDPTAFGNALAEIGVDVDLLASRPVTSVDSLRGYGLAWVVLILEVERDGERTLAIREVGRPQLVATRLYEPQITRKVGFEAVQISSLPPHLRPLTSPKGGALVTWVSPDSTFGLHGLRPLQVLAPGEADERLRRKGLGPYGSLLADLEDEDDDEDGDEDGEDEESLPLIVRDVDGTEIWIRPDELTRQPRTEFELLWGVLLTVRNDPSYTSISIGPAGHVFHWGNTLAYNPRTDRYQPTKKWSLAYQTVTGSNYGHEGRGAGSTFNAGLLDTLPETEIDPDDDGPFFSGPFIFDWSER